MLGSRLKQFRLAKNYSLDELVAATGGIVSKVALSKYERNIIKPSKKVLTAISKALNVKTINLLEQPSIIVEFIAYRKGSRLSKKEQRNIESIVAAKLEDRVKIQDLLYASTKPNIPVKKFRVKSIEDVESFAIELRYKWKLGLDPIANFTEVLENNLIHVMLIDSEKSFDGISALAFTNDTQLRAVAVVSNKNISGERQRLNLAHELGHIVLDVPRNLDEEKVAFRFGGAFLAPKESVLKVVGSHREYFHPRELLILKKMFGMSIQALLYRLRDLDIISKNSFSNWYRIINKQGWKKNEPLPLEREKSLWFEKNVLHAFSEGLISSDEANRLLGDDIFSAGQSVIEKKQILKLSVSERNKILSEQAEKLFQYYVTNNDWKEFGGDIVEY